MVASISSFSSRTKTVEENSFTFVDVCCLLKDQSGKKGEGTGERESKIFKVVFLYKLLSSSFIKKNGHLERKLLLLLLRREEKSPYIYKKNY